MCRLLQNCSFMRWTDTYVPECSQRGLFSNAGLSLCIYIICLADTYSTLFHAEGGSLPVPRSKQGDNKENSSLGKVTGSCLVWCITFKRLLQTKYNKCQSFVQHPLHLEIDQNMNYYFFITIFSVLMFNRFGAIEVHSDVNDELS